VNVGLYLGEKIMPWVTIQWFDGRDAETKKKTVELVTKAICEGCNTTPDHVSIIFQDIKKSDWAGNGKLYSDK